MDRSAKYLKSLVGAPRFELGTSCAQGRRATRLRYAPTESSILAYFCCFPAGMAIAFRTVFSMMMAELLLLSVRLCVIRVLSGHRLR